MRSPTQSIYLDYAATTPVAAEVFDAMVPYFSLGGNFANPASLTHKMGQKASIAVEAAREQVAHCIGAKPNELIWTSGATEANNLAIKGVALAHPGKHIITSTTEHQSVLAVCEYLASQGFQITYLEPDHTGLIAIEQLMLALQDDTCLVSLMYVNNETGVIQNILDIAQVLDNHPAVFHVDATQALDRIPIDLQALPVDLMSCSGHKCYGPKGIGFLYKRQNISLIPQLHGGGHEQGLRAGTLATPLIVGMGQACELASSTMQKNKVCAKKRLNQLWQGLNTVFTIKRHGAAMHCVPDILNISLAGIAAKDIVRLIPEIAISTGSACSSASLMPSHVLSSMGCTPSMMESAIRISFGRYTTEKDIENMIHYFEQRL